MDVIPGRLEVWRHEGKSWVGHAGDACSRHSVHVPSSELWDCFVSGQVFRDCVDGRLLASVARYCSFPWVNKYFFLSFFLSFFLFSFCLSFYLSSFFILSIFPSIFIFVSYSSFLPFYFFLSIFLSIFIFLFISIFLSFELISSQLS